MIGGRNFLYDQKLNNRYSLGSVGENNLGEGFITGRDEFNTIGGTEMNGASSNTTVSEELGTSFESSASYLMTESALARTLQAEERRLRGMSLDEERTKSPSNSSYGGSASSTVLQRLDAGAVAALSELEPAEAEAIAARLEQAGSSVRNPSAYVHRAVNNAKRRALEPRPATRRPQQQQQEQIFSSGEFSLRRRLDASAIAALAELPSETAQAILEELASKGTGKVRNPSAYVVKAVGNARKSGGIQSQQRHPTPHRPDRRYNNRGAIQSLGGSNSTISTTQDNTTLNFAAVTAGSSNTTKNMQNHQQNRIRQQLAAKTPTTTSVAASATQSQIDSTAMDTARAWADSSARSLDSKAAAALLALPPHRAVQILTELKRKRATIRNPSAYVTRATTNALSGHQHTSVDNYIPQDILQDQRQQSSSLLNQDRYNEIIAPAPSPAALFAGTGPRRFELDGLHEAEAPLPAQTQYISQNHDIPRLHVPSNVDTDLSVPVASPPRTTAVGRDRQTASAHLSLSSAPLIFDFGPDLSIAPTSAPQG
uniref:Heterogeneous nuclear ribonucleoprotein Q acidic domain-containing protein n=1 Tax=Aureoumbra lagunensis TaxID=44058 RepID=A0A7S3NH36_9STRA|mmetsp:Transcript_6352/g.8944  ORF Transcript_6352/g.8944 Transcript_6352/m.8944 type:complete len:541 (+) Transcript_6352:290-1912(+)|eukprot:CAMPEP_0197290804 /NCGR_PEP_ID=MMETSP0890-20130614/10220_1 /TAXON_ID=44058 ORGANISM="Aureoumbra lagunensis, Strain CCMP1510" /NCGR_SAMPLE_ID=MMETSP0890 /ASSEMBLY_ACC=CAM_ASM_000533 /LENGTH=540 /DNA_ID=CAMNT_0042763111 /DNA_START=290 /DNA_END=1912 /DNA_ORIENTATION=-